MYLLFSCKQQIEKPADHFAHKKLMILCRWIFLLLVLWESNKQTSTRDILWRQISDCMFWSGNDAHLYDSSVDKCWAWTFCYFHCIVAVNFKQASISFIIILSYLGMNFRPNEKRWIIQIILYIKDVYNININWSYSCRTSGLFLKGNRVSFNFLHSS